MLIKIKNVLKIIISILIITSFIKSCANAWTYNEFMEYLEQVSTSSDAPTTFKNCASHVLRYESNLSAVIDKTCDNYVIYNGTTTGWVGIYAYKGTLPSAYFSTNALQFNSVTMNSYGMDRRTGSTNSRNNICKSFRQKFSNRFSKYTNIGRRKYTKCLLVAE